MIGRLVRRTVAGASCAIAGGAALWTVLLVVSGGIDATLFDRRVTSHDPMRPLLIFALALTLYMLIGGDDRLTRWARWLSGASSSASPMRSALSAWSRAGHLDRA